MTWTTMNCGQCGEEICIKDTLYGVLKRSSQIFYCPHGHQRYFPQGESSEVKLRRERDQLKQQAARLHDRIREERERADKEKHRANGYKGHATKMTKRVKVGLCICCNRSFQDLARHMATKHPTLTPLEAD